MQEFAFSGLLPSSVVLGAFFCPGISISLFLYGQCFSGFLLFVWGWEEVSVVDPDAFQFLFCSGDVENVRIWTVVKRLRLCWSSGEDSKREDSSRQFCSLCLMQGHGAVGKGLGRSPSTQSLLCHIVPGLGPGL